MPRGPSNDPEGPEPVQMAERLATSLRRQFLAAAQATLKALREVLAHVPRDERGRETPQPASGPLDEGVRPSPAAAPIVAPRPQTMPPPPSTELLHDDTPLPETYGTDRLVLLARDPHCLYAYWDLSPEHVERVRTAAGSSALRIVLRTYDATRIPFDATPPARFQDFTVAGGARSLYAYVGKPASSFIAEVGFLRQDGVFFPLARSQPVWTPRTEQPGAAPGQWMTVGWREPRSGADTAHAGEVAVTSSGPAAFDRDAAERRIAARPAPSSWPGPMPPNAQRGSWSLVRGKRTAEADGDAGEP